MQKLRHSRDGYRAESIEVDIPYKLEYSGPAEQIPGTTTGNEYLSRERERLPNQIAALFHYNHFINRWYERSSTVARGVCCISH